MMIYHVYEPAEPPKAIEERAEALTFVRDGFSWWGFLFGPLWLLYNALWLEFAACILIGVGLSYGLTQLGLKDQAIAITNLLLMLVIGFEGNELHRWRLERRDYVFLSPVTGASFEECERRFFQAWLPTVQGRRDAQVPTPVSDINPNSWGDWTGAVGTLPSDTV